MSSVPNNTDYSEADLQVLRRLEHIRVRPQMYIGSPDERGQQFLLEELLLPMLAEARAGKVRQIWVELERDGMCCVRDDGPGVSVAFLPEFCVRRPELGLTCFSVNLWSEPVRTGRCRGYLFACGVCALSSSLVFETHRDGEHWRQEYAAGQAVTPFVSVGPSSGRGTSLTFRFDRAIFGDASLSPDWLRTRLWELACLSAGVAIHLRDARVGLDERIHAPGGMADMLLASAVEQDPLIPTVVHGLDLTANGSEIEIAFRWHKDAGPVCRTFGNDGDVPDNADRFRTIERAVGQVLGVFARCQHDPRFCQTGVFRLPGLAARIAVRVPEPQFMGSRGFRLGNPEVVPMIARLTVRLMREFLRDHPDEAMTLIEADLAEQQLLREAIFGNLQTRFGAVPTGIRDAVNSISDIEHLEAVRRVSETRTMPRFRRILDQRRSPPQRDVLDLLDTTYPI